MSSPLLTIIIATFNSARTLQETLNSVLMQGFRDWEVIVVDGASTDDTVNIIRENASRDGRIRFISEKDKGVYDAMNKGIGLARGEWIYFLGSDDTLWDSKVLTSALVSAGRDELDLIYGDIVSPRYKEPYDGAFDFAKLLVFNISHQAIFYRKSLFDRFSPYNLRYRGYADWDMNIRLFSDDRVRIRYIGGIIARFGPGGLSSRHDTVFLKEVLFPQRLKLLQQTGLRVLRPIRVYDEWWRLLRNAGFADHAALKANAGTAEIPGPILGMATWQERIPRRVLQMGFCSKILMFASYLRHFLTGRLS